MSRNRILAPEKRTARVPRGTCRWCGGPVAPPKRTFCSDACVHEWRIRSDPGYVRECLWKRDHGICAHCGLDTVAEARERYEGRHSRPYPEHWGKRGPWDADHIHPVHLGGGECGLEGYQTLCKDCHKAKSAREAAARAAAARDPEPDHPVTEESPVRYNTCPNHPGHIIESHPCPICGHPAIPPVGREPRRSIALVRNPKPEVEVQDSISTSTLEGERYRVSSAMRLGLAQLLAHRSGARVETLIVDEPEGLDVAGRQHLARILERMSGHFGLILLLTHYDDLKEALPSQVLVSRGADGLSGVEVIA